VTARGRKRNAVSSTGVSTIIPRLTASSLKDALWETLIDLKKDNIQANRADAIAVQAREILRTVKVQLQVARESKRTIPHEIVDFSEK
jgi:hypothetical protein